MNFDRTNIRKYLKLYLVSDRSWLKDHSLSQDIEQAILGGVTMVQIREKELDKTSFILEAKSLKQQCAQYRLPFIVNDNVEVAKEVDADGIHVGQHDQSPIEVRKILGEDKIVGVSVQTVEEATLAQEQGADYLGVGAMFSTTTKEDADDVEIDTLKAIVKAVHIPVIAIGGINQENIQELQHTKIDGIAVVSAILAQTKIQEAAQKLNQLVEEKLQ